MNYLLSEVIQAFNRFNYHRTFSMITAITLLLASEAVAQSNRISTQSLDSLDSYFQDFMSDKNIPGGQYVLARDGQLIVQRSFGFADVELSVPVSDKSIFEIGFISKQFVSASVLLLVEEGKISLDDSIHQYLPWLPGEWLGVTIRHLLTHTSGIPDYETIRSYDVYRFRLTPQEIVQIAHSRPIDFQPGKGFNYSNTGYFLLSQIVERVAGQPFGEVLKSQIFEPLGMKQTGMADPEKIIEHRASGYWTDKNGSLINRPPTETSSTLGAGGLLTTAHDLALWDQALSGTSLLSSESKELMWAPTELPDGRTVNYGFGWIVSGTWNVPVQWHTGQVAGFNAFFARFPAQEAAIIIFLNRYEIPDNFNLYDRVVRTLLPDIPLDSNSNQSEQSISFS